MKILGIETSCDETAIAVLEVEPSATLGAEDDFKILSNVVSSQVKIHRKWGGVVPNLAKREHQRNLVPVLKTALKEERLLKKIPSSKLQIPNKFQIPNSKFKTLKIILERELELAKSLIGFFRKYNSPDIDFIAVVNGPGLEPALWTGVNFAKALAYYWEKPIVPVNHLEGHLLTNFISENFQFSISPEKKSEISNGAGNFQKISFPAVCLLVSGGHTMLVLMEDIGKYKIIGETRDDSAGECLDKTARLLGLGYPGGPAIAEVANKALPRYETQTKLPRPMMNSKNYDFSFSGLKTAVLYHYRGQPSRVRKSKNYVSAMAAEIQQAIVDVLISKTLRAAKRYEVKTVMLGGGVAANSELRRQLGERLKKELPNIGYVVPEPKFCTDNGAMAAVAGYFRWHAGKKTKWRDIAANANLKI